MMQTILDRLSYHAQNTPDKTAFRYLDETGKAEQELSYAELLTQVKSTAEFLQKMAPAGSRIMLFFPPGIAYIRAFFGCLYAGMIAVPLYPPRRNTKSDRVIKVAQSCQSTIALTIASELDNIQAAWDMQNDQGLSLDLYAADSLASNHSNMLPVVPTADTPAFLQYTSGSTGVPKGVIITHSNITANAEHLSLMSTGNRDDMFVNWLPLFHDLGLVTAVLWPAYLGATSILMAPATFVRSPSTWLKAITEYRGTMCGAPNFAYELCVNKIAEEELAGIDLSSWRIAYNAAEPVRADTINNFCARFADNGFTAAAFYPSYGMAEATVFITGGSATAVAPQLRVNKRALADEGIELAITSDEVAVNDAESETVEIVACGAAYAPHDVRVVNPNTMEEVQEGRVGEIWFSGPSVSPGYWQLDDINKETFNQKISNSNNAARYLRTGDLGAIWNGELYVTGRIKDLIILRGRNYYPQDIEHAVFTAHPAIRAGHIAAFSVTDKQGESLVVVAEIEREQFRTIDTQAVISAITQQVLHDCEITPDQIVLLKPYKIPMTSSGKIQRRQTRQLLAEGKLEAIASSSSEKPYLAPSTTTQQALHDIWTQVLNLDKVSISDNFFEVGGTSLSAIEILADIRQLYGESVDMERFLDLPSIALQAEFLDLDIAYKASQSAAKNHSPKKLVKI